MLPPITESYAEVTCYAGPSFTCDRMRAAQVEAPTRAQQTIHPTDNLRYIQDRHQRLPLPGASTGDDPEASIT